MSGPGVWTVNLTVWGIPAGERDRLYETVLYHRNNVEDRHADAICADIVRQARRDGFHSFRFDLLTEAETWTAANSFKNATRVHR